MSVNGLVLCSWQLFSQVLDAGWAARVLLHDIEGGRGGFAISRAFLHVRFGTAYLGVSLDGISR